MSRHSRARGEDVSDDEGIELSEMSSASTGVRHPTDYPTTEPPSHDLATTEFSASPSRELARSSAIANQSGPPSCTIVATFTAPSASNDEVTFDSKVEFSYHRDSNKPIQRELEERLTILKDMMSSTDREDPTALKSRWIEGCKRIAHDLPEEGRLVQYNVIKDITVEDRSEELSSAGRATSVVWSRLKGALSFLSENSPEAEFEDFVAPRRAGRPPS